MELVFIHGPPAVGKLTVARELAALTGLPLFHNHLAVDLLTPLFAFGTPGFVELRERIWLDVFREAARRGVSLIFTFAPERTVRTTFVAQAVQAVEEHGGRVRFVALTCAPDELEHRMTDPTRAEFGKLRSRDQYRELERAGAFAYPALPAALTVDTGSRTPRDAAGLIRDFLERRTDG